MQLAHKSALSLGSLEVRPATREVLWPDGREVLQPRVMQVLIILAQANGEVVSKDDLIDLCWDGRIVSEDAINQVIAKLRKLAGRSGAFSIETIAKVGYRLPPATRAAAQTPAPAPAPPFPRPTATGETVVAVLAFDNLSRRSGDEPISPTACPRRSFGPLAKGRPKVWPALQLPVPRRRQGVRKVGRELGRRTSSTGRSGGRRPLRISAQLVECACE